MPINWNMPLHVQFVSDRGDLIIHEQALACPECRGEDYFSGNLMWEGKPKKVRPLRCGNCNGDGFLYRNANVMRGLVTGIQSGSNRQLIESGFMVPGDCTFSPPPEFGSSVHDFDRITFTNPQPIHDGQVIMRGAANLGENVQLKTNLAENEDRLWYIPDRALWCEDEFGTVYLQDTDFRFDDKKVVWVGAAPKIGSMYVVKYTAYLEWVAFASPMERFDHALNLGPKVMLRKKHVWFSEGSPADTPEKRREEQAAFNTRAKI